MVAFYSDCTSDWRRSASTTTITITNGTCGTGTIYSNSHTYYEGSYTGRRTKFISYSHREVLSRLTPRRRDARFLPKFHTTPATPTVLPLIGSVIASSRPSANAATAMSTIQHRHRKRKAYVQALRRDLNA